MPTLNAPHVTVLAASPAGAGLPPDILLGIVAACSPEPAGWTPEGIASHEARIVELSRRSQEGDAEATEELVRIGYLRAEEPAEEGRRCGACGAWCEPEAVECFACGAGGAR